MTLSHLVEVEFDEFGWELITAEAERQGVSVEDVVRHAALYFLADADSGRLATRISPFGSRVTHLEGGVAVSHSRVARISQPD
jgi:hypothetical protein